MSAQSVRGVLFQGVVKPALWVFAVPVFALWFSSHVMGSWDAEVREGYRASVVEDQSLSESDRQERLSGVEGFAASAYCVDVDPTSDDLRQALQPICDDMWWMQGVWTGSVIALALGVLTMLITLGCGAAAYASQALQIPAFFVGWWFLRAATAAQAIVQGAIAVVLSYWMSAFWFNIFVPKLIFLVALLTGVALWGIVRAIFQRVDTSLPIVGRTVSVADAPALWARVRELAAAIGTAPPDRIVVGIDDQFYVTEADVIVQGERLTGRTLYLSLSLLRVLDRSQADAVLSHELGHFSGGDTAQSIRLAPARARFANHAQALFAGGLTMPVGLQMVAFYTLFGLASARWQRERELRADRIAAMQVGADAAARALVRVSAYSSYRGRVERSLYEREQRSEQLAIRERVRQGFAAYAHSDDLHQDLGAAETPHPFDSHPALQARCAELGASVDRSDWVAVLEREPESTWFNEIQTGPEIEATLWAAYEAMFAASHELELACRYVPNTPEEEAVVRRHFPDQSFALKSGGTVMVDYVRVTHPKWGPVDLDDIANLLFEDHAFRRHLVLVMKGDGLLKTKHRILAKDVEGGAEALGNTLARYRARHHAMVGYQQAQGRQ